MTAGCRSNTDVSVLFGPQPAMPNECAREPACFADLNLDQLVGMLTEGREDYDLLPFFYTALPSPAQANYRQAVFQDLEKPEIRGAVDSFAQDMRDVRAGLARARAVHHWLQKSLLFLDGVLTYCDAVESLASGLSAAGPASAGMRAFRDFLTCHLTSAGHSGLRDHARRISAAVTGIRYTLDIRGTRVVVDSSEDGPDYSDEVSATFAKFFVGQAPIEHRPGFPPLLEVDYVEAGILERVAALFPEPFASLSRFFDERQAFIDQIVSRFEREIEFYLAYLDYLRPARAAGLAFCYPLLSDQSSQTSVSDTFDLVLAASLVSAGQPVVGNDVRLSGAEKLLVVTGPNQAGKTTFARAFGQVHFLASLGCAVPGTRATLHLPDQIFTHFDRGEDIETRGGKLLDDLTRLRDILAAATGDSVIILNEIFTSTALVDALALSARLAERVAVLGCRCLWVTFLDEVARYNPVTVSMVAGISRDDHSVRTFRLERRPADGRAYAEEVARQHQLSYEQVRARVLR